MESTCAFVAFTLTGSSRHRPQLKSALSSLDNILSTMPDGYLPIFQEEMGKVRDWAEKVTTTTDDDSQTTNNEEDPTSAHAVTDDAGRIPVLTIDDQEHSRAGA